MFFLKAFKTGDDKIMAAKTAPSQIPKRYRESEHRKNVAMIAGGKS